MSAVLCLCWELTSRGRQKQMNGRQGRGPKSHKKARFIHLPGPQAIKDPSLPSQASHLPWSPERPQGHTEVRPPVLRPALQLGHAGGWGRKGRLGSESRGLWWAWALLCPSCTRSAEGPREDLARVAEERPG